MQANRTDAVVPVAVRELSTDRHTGLPVAVVVDTATERVYTLSIGISDVASLAAELTHTELAKPTPHRLCAALIRKLGGSLLGIELRTCTVSTRAVATLCIASAEGGLVQQESRVSDALALALHCDAPIWATRELLCECECMQTPSRWKA